MVEHGASIFLKRRETIGFMRPLFADYYREISGYGECADMEYKPCSMRF